MANPALGNRSSLSICARLSRGEKLPDGRPLDRPNTTILLSGEDDPADTICPRLVAAGADLVNVVTGSPGDDAAQLLQPEGIPAIRRIVEGYYADLLILDPVSAFLPPNCGTSDRRMREALAPQAALAADTGGTVHLVRHLSGVSGPGAVFRGRGSIGLLSSARTGLRLSRHPDDANLRVLSVTKNALGAPAASLGFRLASGGNGPALQLTGPLDLTADEACGSPTAELLRRPRERAAEFLKDALAKGPRPVAELEKLAAEKGLNWRTVRRAKETLRIKSELTSTGRDEQGWQWFDPEERMAEAASKLAELARSKAARCSVVVRVRTALHEARWPKFLFGHLSHVALSNK